MAINILTYYGKEIRAQIDAILYNKLTTDGAIYGIDVTKAQTDANVITVAGGYGIIQGRIFEIDEEQIVVPLATTTGTNGQLIIHMDLSNTETPIEILVDTTMRELTQERNVNITNGIYEIQLATFTVDTQAVSDVVRTVETATGAGDVSAGLQQTNQRLTETNQQLATTNQKLNKAVDSAVFWQDPEL